MDSRLLPKAKKADDLAPNEPSLDTPERKPLSIHKRVFGIVPFVSGFILIGSLAYKTYQDGKAGPIKGYLFFGIIGLALISWGVHWMLGMRIEVDEKPADLPPIADQPGVERDAEDRNPVPARKSRSRRRELFPVGPRDSDEPGGALKPLLITFGAVLLAFGGIMGYILATAPKVEVAIGGPPDAAKPPESGADDPLPDDWTPPRIERRPSGTPVNPSVNPPPAASVRATELASLPGPANAINVFRYSDKHDLLFYSQASGTTVLDAKTGQPLPEPKLEGKQRLRSVDVAPDQSAAFASDGQNPHRFDLAARKWDARPFAGTRVLAIDAATVLVQVKASAPATWAVVRWEPGAGGAAKEVGRMVWAHLYELGYDPAVKVLYALNSKTNSTVAAVLERHARAGVGFTFTGSTTFDGATAQVTLHPLTGDGRYFVQSFRAVPTELATNASAQFNEAVAGTVGGWAVGGSGQLYSVATGQPVGKLGMPADAVAAASDGRTVWVHAWSISKFVKYRIEVEK